MPPNLFLLAADNSPELLSLLRSNPDSAASQDNHGYSLLHAAVSYNHLNILDALINEFKVNVNLKDEDGETALFVAETIECASRLVEVHGADITVRGLEGKTAREKIAEENEFPQVAVYLRKVEIERQVNGATGDEPEPQLTPQAPAPLPQGVTVDIRSMQPEDAGEVVDTEFRRRIDELAAREDFNGDEGQRLLRALITEAIGGIPEERDVRPRHS